ncbi:MAG: hypothetical protein WCD72_02370 [Dehalococcoidia bacterium]
MVGIALINRFEKRNDYSYLIPILVTSEQKAKIDKCINAFDEHQLGHALKSDNWNKIISEIRANNSEYLQDTTYRSAITRICITDNLSSEEPDDFQELPGFGEKVPVFLYTSPDRLLSLSREQLNRELNVRLMFSNDSFETVANTIRNDRHWMSLPKNHPFIHVINRVETELQMNYDKQRPSITNFLLDPALSVFTLEPNPTFRPTSKGSEIMKLIEDKNLKTGFSITNWDEPNIAQVTQHVFYNENVSLKDSAISPAITIFRDEMGIHTMPTEIFRIDTTIFSLSNVAEGLIFVDELEPPQIPEINLGPVSDPSSDKWWQKDTIAKKILWLVAHYFVMRILERPEYLLFSVTPILDNTIQISLLFEILEEGRPYAFAVIKDDFIINAIPVFTSGTHKFNPDGSITTQKMHSGKNYAISRDGKRISNPLEIKEFIKPIYSPIVSGKYKDPQVYYSK